MATPALVYDKVPRGAVYPYVKLNSPVLTQSRRAGGQRDTMCSIQVDIFDEENTNDSQRAVLLSSAAIELLADEAIRHPATDGFNFIDQTLEIERTQEETDDEGKRIWHQIAIIEFHCNQITI
ncbi:MAG: DUF3168 domain-containing protein [Ketobacter sp.]|nr:DUF3168 domain-containing protein [Ketobacter sp.]